MGGFVCLVLHRVTSTDHKSNEQCLEINVRNTQAIPLAVWCAGVNTNVPEYLPVPCIISPGWGRSILICRLLRVNSGLGLCCPCPGFREVAWSLARQQGIISAVSKLMLLPLTGEKRQGLILNMGGWSNVKEKYHKMLVPVLFPAR